MTGIGIAVEKFFADADNDFSNAIRHHHRAHRQIAGGESFRDRHQIRLDVVVMRTEPFAGATEAADHFVSDKKNLTLGADATDFGPIGFRRNDHTTGALNGFRDKSGNAVLA